MGNNGVLLIETEGVLLMGNKGLLPLETEGVLLMGYKVSTLSNNRDQRGSTHGKQGSYTITD